MKNRKNFIAIVFLGVAFICVCYFYVISTPIKAVEAFRNNILNDITLISSEKTEEGTVVYSAGHVKMDNDNFYCVDLVKRAPITYKWVGGGGHNHRDIIGIDSESYILSAQVLNETQGINPTIFGIIKDDKITGIKISGDFEGSYEAKIFKGLDQERIYGVNFDVPIAEAKIYNILVKRNDGEDKEILIMPNENFLEGFNIGKNVFYYRGKGIEDYGLGINKKTAEEIAQKYGLKDKIKPSIKIISGEKYLISYFETDDPIMNPMCFVYDFNLKESVEVEYTNDYIEDITNENGEIIFHSKGNNVFNGFKKFPLDFLLNVETGKLIPQTVYKSLSNYDEQVFMGNWFNETRLEGIEVTENTISFDFGISENSILAGGDFCPNIIIKPAEKGILSVSIENLKYDEDQMKGYSHKETIDGDYGKYTEIMIASRSYDSYSVKFITEDDGVMNMKIFLK